MATKKDDEKEVTQTGGTDPEEPVNAQGDGGAATTPATTPATALSAAEIDAMVEQKVNEQVAAVVASALAEKEAQGKPATKGVQNTQSDQEELVEIRINKDRKDQSDVTVSVNGKVYRIKRGEKVKVPKYIVAVLENTRKMDELRIERIENATKNFSS